MAKYKVIWPFKKQFVNMWSTENAGSFLDINAEVELWTRAGHIKVNLKKGIDVRKFDKLIAEALL